MSRMMSVLPVSSLLLVILLLPQAYSQDAKKADPKAAPAKTDATPTKPEASPSAKKGRLPSNYGKLELSDEQRDKIYGIQARHHGAIDKLEKQLEDLKGKRAAEFYAVLTKPQQTKLNELNSAAKKKDDANSEMEKP